MKTPPDRSGITFEVGAQLEARDRHKNWYPATIERVEHDAERILVHYKHWSRRHDEWFHWNSPYLRPLDRVSLRRRGLNPSPNQQMFVSGSRVLACWTDCRFYPAKVLTVNKDDSYTVRFYDGVVRTVKPTKIKAFQQKSRCEKTVAVGSEGWEEGESEEEEGGGVEREEAAEGVKEEEEEKKEVKEEEQEVKEELEQKEEKEDGDEKEEPSCSHLPCGKRKTDDHSDGDHSLSITAGSAPAPAGSSSHIDPDVLLERQAHLPTTHKFSREPLYRVIKKQPPPILSIELDHNPFKCAHQGCTKSFRKAALLHYHIKYYHSDAPPAAPPAGEGGGAAGGGSQEAPRRKRPPSEGADFLLERRRRSSSCYHDDGEQSIMGRDVKDEEGKNRKKFLRVKLKKKKKKKKRKKCHTGVCSSDDDKSDQHTVTLTHHNTHTPADEGSDWSTLTAESGEDTPSWQVAMEMEDCEVVRCVCEVDEENDFMIQCESCLCWQHGTCMGLYEDNVPHNYICYYCRSTAGWRRAQRVLSEPDWLLSGHMFGLSCLRENYSSLNSSQTVQTNHLLAHCDGLQEALRGLQLKISLLHAPSHPDLTLWRLPWRHEEEEEGQTASCSPGRETALCYVSSEHCYQKPGASWEDSGLMVSHSLPLTEVQEDSANGVAAEPRPLSVHGDGAVRSVVQQAAPHVLSEVKCRINLLNHVEALQRQITERMELVDRELNVMESWLDQSGELEPPDPLSRLSQLKQRIRRLLCDLCVVRRLSVCR